VLQDLTFVHIGNSDLLPDGSINFSKRWQQFNIVENMKRFKKGQVPHYSAVRTNVPPCTWKRTAYIWGTHATIQFRIFYLLKTWN
jgi:hypothetical protein